ncbi:MAG TPA: hypothetical protein VMV95_03275 [Bacillota bacterium]|nr:hypothetical protein [Bacillota bacterium]
MIEKKKIKAFKFYRPEDRHWSIILAQEEFAAQELYMEEMKYTKEKFDKDRIKKEQLRPSYKLPSIWSGNLTTIGALINTITFFPRCVLESTDLEYLKAYHEKEPKREENII